jgi:hypothetical protein
MPPSMAASDTTVHTLGQFVDCVTPREPDRNTGRRRDTGVYRGASETSRGLLTTLDRLGGTDPPHTKVGLEEHILRNFIRYSRPHLDESRAHDDWELLVAAQHHGVPTRLLDWTYSPLVAAFFATRPCDGGERDRAIWRLDWQRVHQHFGLQPLAMLIEDLGSAFGDGKGSSPFDLFARRGDAFACMLEPPSLDSRIVAQAATFTFMSATDRTFDRFLEEHGLGDALTRYVIPAPEVATFRDQLDLVGLDERRLFPDLDGVASAIQRYYA